MADCILCFAIAVEWAMPSCQGMVMVKEEREEEKADSCSVFCIALHCIPMELLAARIFRNGLR